MRRKLRDRIREVYETQDRCAYKLGITPGTISRIITGTADLTDFQIDLFGGHLGLTADEIREKDDEEDE